MSKEQMPVTAIQNGSVIDHIPADKLFDVIALLCLEEIETPITIGNNLPSRTYGSKGVIKLADRFFSEDEINRIAIVAPHVKLNIIKEYKVIEKISIEMPNDIKGLVRCTNPKCITRNEPMLSHFKYTGQDERVISCKYCGRKVRTDQVELL